MKRRRKTYPPIDIHPKPTFFDFSLLLVLQKLPRNLFCSLCAMISLFIAGLFVVAAVDSLPQLIQPFDQTLVGSPDSTIAYNPDSPQNAIGTFDSPTNPPNFFGSTAGLEDLTKSTETAQMSSVLSKNPATWFSYNLPNSDVSAAPNTPSNSDVSSGSVVSYNANDSPKSLDTLTSNDQTPISSIKGVPDTPGEDELVAQEGVIPEGVLPKFGSPGGITPSGSDVTTPVPDSAISNPDWSYTDVERYPRIDGEENHEPDCTQLNGYNPRIAMCCTRGPPFIRGSYKTSPTGQSILDPTKLTRRGNCDLCTLRFSPSCFRRDSSDSFAKA